MQVPLNDLHQRLAETRPGWKANLADVFARSQFVLGPQVAAFEQEFAAFLGGGYVVAVGSGTDAITLALLAAGVRPGSQVITSALTSPFTGIAILRAGAQPVFADVDPNTLQIDPASVAQKITRHTAAIVPVHLYGQPSPLDQLKAFRLPLVQDACQAHGATYLGRPLLAWSPLAAFSFYPTKNLGCLGDGGAVWTSSKRLAGQLRMLRDGGRRGGQISYRAGLNSRLDEIQAAYLRAFLSRLSAWNQRRREIAATYDRALHSCSGLTLLKRSTESVCHLYVVKVKRRERLRAFLSQVGVQTGIHYPLPLHLQKPFRSARNDALPIAEQAARQVLTLPGHPHLTTSQIDHVISAALQFSRM